VADRGGGRGRVETWELVRGPARLNRLWPSCVDTFETVSVTARDAIARGGGGILRR
jgi:hypothetical protein